MRYLKKLKVADLLVIVILLVALIAAWIAIRTYVKKEADYKASLEEYEKIKTEYVIQPEDNSTNALTADAPDDLSKPADETQAEELPINPPVIDWGGLKAENSDIIGWIEVPAVRIQYPVLQGESNDEYLHKTVNGEWRTAGSIFLDRVLPMPREIWKSRVTSMMFSWLTVHTSTLTPTTSGTRSSVT